MQVSITLIGIIVAIAIIWIIAELRRKEAAFRHRTFAIFVIVLLLFTYLSFTFVLNGKNLNLSSWDDLKQAGGLYLSWLGSVFGNMKSLGGNAIKMDWGLNETNISQNLASSNVTNSG
ncbi:MAG: hypothetical protein KGH55_01890 [Nanoarchaeota archaeon]|nr:hypothetical protein [Nanoarchaeota archaeon]